MSRDCRSPDPDRRNSPRNHRPRAFFLEKKLFVVEKGISVENEKRERILQGINKRVNVFPLRSANDLFSRVWLDGGGMEIQDSRVAGNESSMGRSNR